MRTLFETEGKYAEALLRISRGQYAGNHISPERFKKKMRENRGVVKYLSPFDEPEDGLEPRNPVVVAIGDSVTAGHFEFTGDPEKIYPLLEKGHLEESIVTEISDPRESYIEKFRNMLIDKYEQTAVSIINAGIAGDTLRGISARLERDVFCYHPDLVILNGTLNWPETCGDSREFEKLLRETVRRMKEEIPGDLILMTPNMEIPGPFANPASRLEERVEAIRKTADEEKVCLADGYKIWEEYERQGYPILPLLANGANHPSKQAHEAFANMLMKVLEG